MYLDEECRDGKQIMVAKFLVNIIPSIEAKFKLFESTVIDCKLEHS